MKIKLAVGNDLVTYIENIESYSGIDGLQAANLLANKIFYDFDHNKREWIHTTYSSKDLIELSFKKNSDKQFSLYNSSKFLNSLNKHEGFPNFNHPYKLYDIITDLEKNVKLLRFRAYGKLIRDCGQLLIIGVGNDDLQPEFFGPWYVYSIAHVWTGTDYYNDFTCIRPYNFNPKGINE